MTRPPLPPTGARTWRDIPQHISPRAMSLEGKKRLAHAALQTALALLTVAVLGWSLIEIIDIGRHNPAQLANPTSSAPLRAIAVTSDGVLGEPWVRRTLDIPREATLMGLDLTALQTRLYQSGQVQSAILSRRFPDRLVVSLQERTPVARVRAQRGTQVPETLLVARDGTVYSGAHYPEDLLASLPYLGGVRLVQRGEGFAPITDMATVADLLAVARDQAPERYRAFRLVSLGTLATDGTLAVHSSEVDAIIFGLRSDQPFLRQLARLDYIVDEARRQQTGVPIKRINLAIGGSQVPVSFELPPQKEPAPRRPNPPPPAPTRTARKLVTTFNAHPQNHLFPPRDL